METDGLTSTILEREGYYSIVNGYKDPEERQQEQQLDS